MIYIGGHGIWYCTVLFALAGDVCYDMTDWYSSGECEYAVVEYSNVAIDRPEDAHGTKWGRSKPLIPPIKLSRVVAELNSIAGSRLVGASWESPSRS